MWEGLVLMGNPVEDALNRKVRCAAWQFVDPPGAAEDIARRAITAAHAPIRELHYPIANVRLDALVLRGELVDVQVCNECTTHWPCETALLVYTDDELYEGA